MNPSMPFFPGSPTATAVYMAVAAPRGFACLDAIDGSICPDHSPSSVLGLGIRSGKAFHSSNRSRLSIPLPLEERAETRHPEEHIETTHHGLSCKSRHPSRCSIPVSDCRPSLSLHTISAPTDSKPNPLAVHRTDRGPEMKAKGQARHRFLASGQVLLLCSPAAVSCASRVAGCLIALAQRARAIGGGARESPSKGARKSAPTANGAGSLGQGKSSTQPHGKHKKPRRASTAAEPALRQESGGGLAPSPSSQDLDPSRVDGRLVGLRWRLLAA
eukprot:CAMPEP_0177603670 /NCGR_PEP_ID=MMETSP0419_2-20121207/15650_1 /TAXON_ID=582737 /ORGANISM="Tetraselmis sp., Strain GSL018" /LENGTH=272 /DNA_ID=CAMNT_0019097485 /DNA_START=261 /DNA_END=1081 /DNA_ORIENTATION=-